ncbi:Transposase [Caenorhabditis elegans]|uniref:Transposase n=1 Tax=Caenorhabditis elegans TaxID=6239 RepID=Q9XVR9_CAEEL|nr:Transposase [Caenorhabditis elegans]CAB02760.1 Transposase [Caenorhabditis elegans]|eukprot:NP_492688.1 Uncharacterized protein CELE_C25A1.15 [Caenorhabditis elegans]
MGKEWCEREGRARFFYLSSTSSPNTVEDRIITMKRERNEKKLRVTPLHMVTGYLREEATDGIRGERLFKDDEGGNGKKLEDDGWMIGHIKM